MPHRPIDIIVPVYRNGQLLRALLDSLRDCRDGLERLAARLIIGNDSPGDPDTAAVIASAECDGAFRNVAVIRNEERHGFVQTVNRAFALSIAAGHDALLLNSDTVVFPGALEAIVNVAYRDPMIGFVSPRSNNAAIFSLPQQPELSQSDPEQAYAAFSALVPRLPEYHYMPTAIGFCLFIKLEILQRFGVFDEAFGFGYQEENDLIMRANQCGYVAAAANHAFVFHVGGASVAIANLSRQEIDSRNAALIEARYPKFFPAIGQYYLSPRYRAELLQVGFLPDTSGRLSLALDGCVADCGAPFATAAETWTGAFRICAADAGSSALPQISSAALHVGAPGNWDAIIRMSRSAPVNVFLMHDTAPVDCASRNISGVADIWSFVFNHADAVVFTSEFSQMQFSRRFQKRIGLIEAVLPPSTVASDGWEVVIPKIDASAAPVLRAVVETSIRTHSVEHLLIPRLATLARIEQCIAAETRIQNLAGESKSWCERAAKMDSALGRARDELSEVRTRALRAERALEELRAAAQDQHAVSSDLRRRVADLEASISWRDAVSSDLRRRVTDLEASISWRVTAPLRSVGRLLKRSSKGTVR